MLRVALFAGTSACEQIFGPPIAASATSSPYRLALRPVAFRWLNLLLTPHAHA